MRLSVDKSLPIEHGIMPLVYEMTALNIFTLFWSCEGHNDSEGELIRQPEIWFYSELSLYARFLGAVTNALYAKGKITFYWHVSILTFSSPITAYRIHPDLIL
ncbi:hypothetical protein BGC07_00880 [Piscirickettsia litoralis]|uniref:Uncharacterized protein n=1 Tax=Piscirickettsia litoralis TaxID=1891921 RepID=A0ABX3A0L1_9GAMM|nr:hypothetical protein BGC07_00880 [Piscirickettsia litoralis]